MSASEPVDTSFVSALFRAFWMLLGHATAIVLALSIAALPSWTLGWRDVVYWACITAIVATRSLDVIHYAGTTGSGEPMTRAMLARWSIAVLVCFAGLWLAVQSIRF